MSGPALTAHSANRSAIAAATPGFRSDINGLRAIAAGAVVLYHFGTPGFSGGFVGVDIFFVISGLLMTQIIEREIGRGTFSLWAFYGARVRRIVPAITVCCLVVLGYGAIWLDPLTTADLARSALSTLLFISNISYALKGSYFADAAETNWFLHSWTLSVEWQFYLLYPVVLSLASRWDWLWRHRAKVAGIACLVLFVATILAASYSNRIRDLSFFLLPSRAWEMLAGGWLAFAAPTLPSAAGRRWLGLAGMVLVGASLFLIDSALPWPSLWMILPVGGTLLMLAADDRAARWASPLPVRKLGLWSYSLYLWHWPVVVAFTYHGLTDGIVTTTAGVALSVALAACSYRWVETALRRQLLGERQATPRQWAVAWALWLGSVAITAAAVMSNGFVAARTAQLTPSVRAELADYDAATRDWVAMSPCHSTSFAYGRRCDFGPPNGRRVLLIGDSHAEQMIPRFARMQSVGNPALTLVRLQGCPPVPGLHWTQAGTECSEFAERAFALAEKGNFERVIVFAAWAVYFAPNRSGQLHPERLCSPGQVRCHPFSLDQSFQDAAAAGFAQLAQQLAKLRQRGIEVYLVLPQPAPPGDEPKSLFRNAFFGARSGSIDHFSAADFAARSGWVRRLLIRTANTAGAKIIDPTSSQCPNGACPLRLDGRYVYKDTHHVRSSVVTNPSFNWIDYLVRKP